MSLLNNEKSTKLKTTHRLAITSDDSKILGNYERKLEKTQLPSKFKTNLYKTHKSNWTPIVNKPSNEQIFTERRDLVSNWFDLWTDSQRKRFLDVLFRRCKKSQLAFVQKWFNDRVPLLHLDFTNVLPRFLSLYVFSFLDPRSLCRASMVSWHWKFLTEQDTIWMPKCTRRGWYLPYTTENDEYGAWKRHYVACIKTLDMLPPSSARLDKYGRIGDGTQPVDADKKRNKYRSGRLSPNSSSDMLSRRPVWKHPDHRPKDLTQATTAFREGLNPNDPELPDSALLYHNRWGIPKLRLTNTEPVIHPDMGLDSSTRRANHRALTSGEDHDLLQKSQRRNLSRSLDLENFTEKRMMELVRQPWEPPPPEKRVVPRRPNLAGGGEYPIPWRSSDNATTSMPFPTQAYPRVIFISSRIPAADVLVDAVLFGVIPIVYEYEGTTLESLLSQLEKKLQGRQAQSIGIFVHSDIPGEMRLVRGATVTLESLENAEFVQFFETICNSVLPTSENGQVDIFVPLASCEPGLEMLTQLSTLTGMRFSSPTGIIGNFNHINSEWMFNVDATPPPALYFATMKTNVWANTADQVQEAIVSTKKLVSKYLDKVHRDVVSQVTGQIIFDAIGQVDIQGVDTVTEALVEGFLKLGHQNNENPLKFLGNFLLEKSGAFKSVSMMHKTMFTRDQQKTMRTWAFEGDNLTSTQTLSARLAEDGLEYGDETFEAEDEEVAEITGSETSQIKEEIEEDIEEIIEEDIVEDVDENIAEGEEKKDKEKDVEKQKVDKHDKKKGVTLKMSSLGATTEMETMVPETVTPHDLQEMKKSLRTMRAQEFIQQPDKRTFIAREILSSEIAYKRTLEIIKDNYYTPLQASLNSNRAIISAQAVQAIFTDPLKLLELSRDLTRDLQKRLDNWSLQQCLGDVFVKFNLRLKAYTNFLSNYPVILSTVERSMETEPKFRAFLKRHDAKADTKMLILQELLLTPAKRVAEYITLLTWLQTFTPNTHADRTDLASAIRTLRELESLVQETKLQCERENEIVALQKKILNCPALMEANRFFIKQEDVAHLMPPSNSVVPELRVYQHVEMLGLFLFNDALVVARRTTKHFPFERAVEHSYRFQSCVALTRLRIDDVPDSKYAKNCFKLYTPRRSWICTTDTYDEKLNWMTVVESAVLAALEG